VSRVGGDSAARTLEACAALRVRCFYRYDHETRDANGALLFGEASEDARRAWVERRLRSETTRARRLSDLGMRVTSFAATRRAPDDATLATEKRAFRLAEEAEAARWDLNRPPKLWEGFREVPDVAAFDDAYVPSSAPFRCLIPLGPGDTARREVVGTVDVHVGARLPGEFLEGAFPSEKPARGDVDRSETFQEIPRETRAERGAVDVAVAAAASFSATASLSDAVVAASGLAAFAEGRAPELPSADPAGGGEGYAGGGALDGRRAYVFNVCVARHARNLGVAKRLLRAVHVCAADAGVEYVYCHVERGNHAARGLYEKMGYVPEAEESDWLAGKLGKPPRVLMRKSLV
jgi:ribosomal protein S18 acetylase RimI-like enzyme